MSIHKKTKPRIHVKSLISLIDSPIQIYITGLEPLQEVTIRASRIAEGINDIYLESNATFIATNDGNVNLTEQAPISGSYTGIDGMGLFWSLDIIKINKHYDSAPNYKNPLSPQNLTLSLEINGSTIDEISILRLWKSKHIVRYPIRENGLVATFFYNENKKANPGIIVLGGSEGGLNEYLAALLASHGFSVLALAYFGIENLPQQLVEIPLEYIKTAIEWMKKREEVTKNWLGIHGTSRGSELALLSACFFQEINAVTSLNGSAIALSGIVPWSDTKTLPPAWTYKGKALPYASPENPISVALECRKMYEEHRGNPYRKWYDALTSNSMIVENATIPVEKINGDVLLIAGEEDEADIVRLSKKAINRLNSFNSPYFYKQLVYKGAGHSIGIPYLRVNYNQGSKKDNAFASIDSWKKTIHFFQKSAQSQL
ncbi:hypothetical protein CN268_13230 [Bacillus anthracis]|uniref:acyl-CoA thioesterase/bile acid-CoA:amino acid N-acyltransferase family protein n=1 Tax=Bacillus tropicus TaxID=2026188 RepID=UPI000BF52A15|nr:hypothetical protein CN340_22250 [Bacillus anthracis]PFB61456.1 hypothetical protein CN268_13230 [Bacillus anthracis]